MQSTSHRRKKNMRSDTATEDNFFGSYDEIETVSEYRPHLLTAPSRTPHLTPIPPLSPLLPPHSRLPTNHPSSLNSFSPPPPHQRDRPTSPDVRHASASTTASIRHHITRDRLKTSSGDVTALSASRASRPAGGVTRVARHMASRGVGTCALEGSRGRGDGSASPERCRWWEKVTAE